MSNGPLRNWGHPVAYHPTLARFFGSVNAALLFQQIRYWVDRTNNPLGVYKTSDEFTEELGISYREQVTARKILTASGFVIETNKRLEHRLYYRIDWDAFNYAFDQWAVKNSPELLISASVKTASPRIDKSAVREGTEQQVVYKETETTTETTTESKSRAKRSVTRPDDVPEQIWSDFLSIRKAKRAPLTDTALEGLRREAEKAGVSIADALGMCCARGWQGFKADWLLNEVAKTSAPVRRMPTPENFKAVNYGKSGKL